MDNPIISHLRKPPKLKGIKRALFIQPHADDNQIGAGGMMALLIDSGAEVFELTVTDDRKLEQDKEGFTTRQLEALSAQNFLNVKNAGFLGFCDKTQEPVEKISQAIMKVIRGIKPDAVFTVDPNLATECHSDHIKTGTAVKYAVLDAMCDFYPYSEDGKARHETWTTPILAFYYTDKPNRKVDISKYIDKKMDSIKCHKSQVDNNLLMFVKELAKIAAKGTKYKYAEQFRALSSLQTHCFNIAFEEDDD
ncbi:MAG: 1D-myo-inositol 2-acetamido-2-deoxy-alpha-D-glucopyranoside deacetylase [Firmicutes bacterium ADurb.Bin146]|nr:MAG: 1D-myo-inositol 2-acetamido-2-deoxy-alpha-D-glucopyranoside deacetylase [Firmicutes bacterium ADurb.Bin146]